MKLFCPFLIFMLLLFGASVQAQQSFDSRLLQTVTLDARGLNITDVLKSLAQKAGLNVVISPSVNGRITVYLPSISVKEALDTIAGMNQLAYFTDKEILQI